MNWLRKLFHDPDPIEVLLPALHEPEAEMYQEMLASSGIPAAIRNRSSLAAYRLSVGPTFDLLVKRSDLEGARQVLAPMVEGAEDPEGFG